MVRSLTPNTGYFIDYKYFIPKRVKLTNALFFMCARTRVSSYICGLYTIICIPTF